MASCMMCRQREKTWAGDDPKCSFEDGGEFNADGWNCATANAIRSLCNQDSAWSDDEKNPNADYRYCDDQNYSTIKVDGIDGLNALALWVTWYKHRGRTEAMWLLNPYDAPRKPTEAECLQIVEQTNLSAKTA